MTSDMLITCNQKYCYYAKSNVMLWCYKLEKVLFNDNIPLPNSFLPFGLINH